MKPIFEQTYYIDETETGEQSLPTLIEQINQDLERRDLPKIPTEWIDYDLDRVYFETQEFSLRIWETVLAPGATKVRWRITVFQGTEEELKEWATWEK